MWWFCAKVNQHQVCIYAPEAVEPFPNDREPRGLGFVRGGGSGEVFGAFDRFAVPGTLFGAAGVDLQRTGSLLYRSLLIHRGTVDVRSCACEVKRRSIMPV